MPLSPADGTIQPVHPRFIFFRMHNANSGFER